MSKRIIFILNLSILFSSFHFIALIYLPFKKEIIENFYLYNNTLPASTPYYIRFPPSKNENFEFFIITPNDTKNLSIYMAEFNEYPEDDVLNETSIFTQLSLKEENNSSNHKYSIVINCKYPFVVIYLLNQEPLNYLSFYANGDSSFNDIDSNYNFESKNVKANEILYFRVDIKKYSGSTITIRLIFDKNSVNSGFVVDAISFRNKPEENEIFILSENWKININAKDIEEPDNNKKEYSFETNNDDEYLVLRIESKIFVENLGVIVVAQNKSSYDSGLATWIIVIISIVSAIVIFVIIGIIVNAIGGKDCCSICTIFFSCCCCICSCLGSISK